MSNFNEIYNKTIKNIDYQPNTFDSQIISEMNNLKYKWFNIYEIFNEYIEDVELTPVISGYNKILKKSKISPSYGFGNYIKNKDYFDLIFNNNYSLNMQKFAAYIIKSVEQDPSVKHILSYFRLIYQYEVSEKKNDIINNRLNWLNNKLTNLENITYYKTDEWKNKLNLIQQDYNNLLEKDKILFNFIYAELGYLICNKVLTNKNIKNKLINYFKTFIYGEY